jgi:hypothetical protein
MTLALRRELSPAQSYEWALVGRRNRHTMKDTLDFIVIGAQKAGTTSLFEYLRTNPSISLPASKEMPYFSCELERSRGWEDYMRRVFAFADPSAKWGTVTPQYMVGGLVDQPNPSPAGDVYDERTIPLRIRDHAPDAKLIAILRDPVQRAHSHHRMMVMEGAEQRSFDEAVRDLLRPQALERSRRCPVETTGYVTWGEYGRILSGYLDVFSREQFLVLFTEELELNPASLLERVREFLEVEEAPMPDNLGHRYRTGGTDRRFSWLRPYALQSAITQLPAMRACWHLLPEGARRLVDHRFMRAAYRLDLWNRSTKVADEQPQLETLELLRDHFAPDLDRLQAELGLTVPWRNQAADAP